MLLELKVSNLGIIADMTWRLASGLNVITGETGAGKSLVIDAIEFLLSGRAEGDIIRYGANETLIEGVFTWPEGEKSRPLLDLLEQRGIDDSDETLIISCLIRRQTPVVIRLNGHTCPRSFLQAIGRGLVDIHGQSTHLSLLDNRTHLDYVDAWAKTSAIRRTFGLKTNELRRLQGEILDLKNTGIERTRRSDYLHYQLAEIDGANLRENEEEELESEWRRISAAEQLKELSYEAYMALDEEDRTRGTVPALKGLNSAIRALKKLAEIDPALAPLLDRLEDAAGNVTGVARDIRDYGERVNNDPERLTAIDARRELIRGLRRKYGPTIRDILNGRAQAEKELAAADSAGERLSRLEESLQFLRREMGEQASRLSRARLAAAGLLAAAVRRELADLNMAQVSFDVALSQHPDPDGLPLPNGLNYAFDDDGADTVEFLAATNPGEPVRPLARIASTGELSRFTLALKCALSAVDSIPILVFDEIDIGIGGRSGEVIGKKLWRLGREHQVICVTHLPQIAAFADSHFRVRKEIAGARTLSLLEPLIGSARLEELALMLTGTTPIGPSLESARELLTRAAAWQDTPDREKTG